MILKLSASGWFLFSFTLGSISDSVNILFLYSKLSKPTVGSNWTLVEWVVRALPRELKRPECEADQSPPVLPRLRMSGAIPPFSYTSWCRQEQFTFILLTQLNARNRVLQQTRQGRGQSISSTPLTTPGCSLWRTPALATVSCKEFDTILKKIILHSVISNSQLLVTEQ
jgi:hypothetical protein